MMLTKALKKKPAGAGSIIVQGSAGYPTAALSTGAHRASIDSYSPIDALATAGFPLVLEMGGVVVILGVNAH